MTLSGKRVKLALVAGLLASGSVLAAPAVPVAAARMAAEDQLPRLFPGAWSLVTNFVEFTAAGEPAAQVFVFGVPALTGIPAFSLPAHIESMRAAYDAQQRTVAAAGGALSELSGKRKAARLAELSDRLDAARRVWRGEDAFITVMTGATDAQPLLIKAHRGLPDTLVDEADLLAAANRAAPGPARRVQRRIYIGPFDEALELAAAESHAAAAGLQTAAAVAPTIMIHVQTRDILPTPTNGQTAVKTVLAPAVGA